MVCWMIKTEPTKDEKYGEQSKTSCLIMLN